MNYTSTRDRSVHYASAQTIVQGISREGGLFVPESLPALSLEEIMELSRVNYQERACRILSGFLTDFSAAEIRQCVEGAYGGGKFDNPATVPLSKLDENCYLMELWHGPTCAFKDMALQLLPRLMTVSAQKTGEKRTIAILVATSGDTGKAALEGFKDVPGAKMVVFYPQDGVSPMQKLQMVTQDGGNVAVCGIEGNFDDAQSGVKAIFTDAALAKTLAGQNVLLSSANSINWGRLVPQIVYYVSAYCDLLADEEIALGDRVNVTVPTVNFGNILAAFYAREMGLPIGRLICASNQNNVLTDFLTTGVYDRNRPFHTTLSPSMDILISSNLERLLYHLSGRDAQLTASLMEQLAKEGRYQAPAGLMSELKGLFRAGCCDDIETKKAIRDVFEQYSYLLDTHTAVAVSVAGRYQKETGDNAKMLVASTANPYKFTASVLEALAPAQSAGQADEFAKMEAVARLTGAPIPAPLAGLRQKQVRFKDVCPKEGMLQFAVRALEVDL